jgi:homoserine O-acetyltransferase/O-succinyltransferase
MVRTARTIFFATAILMLCAAAQAQELKFAELGDFRLENGQIIKQCRIGYRTFGALNSRKSNAVIYPTWFSGTTGDLAERGFIGSGKLADSSKYFIIAVDSLGNGVSSSPSNSSEQPGAAFPAFSIRDMVESEYTLATKFLGLKRVFAVVGISMGGFQTLEWMVAHPEFMDRAVSISGSPRLTAYDLMVWDAETRSMELTRGTGAGAQSALRIVAAIHSLALRTPTWLAGNVPPENAGRFLADVEKALSSCDVNNWVWQSRAIMNQDIFRRFGGSAEKAAAAVRAKTLMVVSKDDQYVYPEPARAFAGILKAEIHELSGGCGHLSFFCQQKELGRMVNTFLGRTL